MRKIVAKKGIFIGQNPIISKKKFEGRCVKIIVAIAPILATNLYDMIPLIPPKILQMNNIAPNYSKLLLKRL